MGLLDAWSKANDTWSKINDFCNGKKTYLTGASMILAALAGLIGAIAGHDLTWMTLHWKELCASPSGIMLGLGWGMIFQRQATAKVEAKIDAVSDSTVAVIPPKS